MAWATTATAAVVSPTATTTRQATGSQLSRRSRSDASKAASSRTGATNNASTNSGGRLRRGAPGMNATKAPPSARKTGYGAPTRRAAAASRTAATKRARTCSSSLMRAVWSRTLRAWAGQRGHDGLGQGTFMVRLGTGSQFAAALATRILAGNHLRSSERCSADLDCP
jgi:hypothetical protein